MTVSPPRYLQDLGVIGAPITYKWNENIAADLAEKENGRLQDAINKTNFKGTMAISAALIEYITWRFHSLADIADALQRTEAAWAAVIDPAYTHGTEYLEGETRGPVEGPLCLALDVLNGLYRQYAAMDPNVSEETVVAGMIARHVAPDKKKFEAWLTSSLRRVAKLCPMDLSHYDEKLDKYDSSYERPISKEAFDLAFEYREEMRFELLQRFLEGLDPQANPYLVPAEEMRRNGFAGTPYRL